MGSGSAKKCGAGAAGWSAVILCTIFTAFSIYFGRDVSTVRAAEDGSIPQPSSAKIYSGMSEDSDVIANLIVGNGFEVAGAENDDAGGVWYRVRADFGAEGYVKAGEMDRLIADAQAMLPQITADADREPPAPADDSAGEPSDPENTDGGEASAEAPPSGDDSAGDTPVQAEDNAGEEQAPEGSNAEEGQDPAEDNVGEGQVPEGSNADEGQDPAEDNAGEGQEPAEGDIAGAETIGGQAQVPPGETAADPVDGAGAGRETDDSAAESMVIGSEGFTVIERTDNQAVHRHGGIDVVLAMIIAGGMLCITAIAALLRSAMKCVRTEV
ncbi:MAG: hypothetical protein HFH75_04365 [Lachnospiraceae bacterium]|nr:hypothetical protein [Lachnospiraceae bacterium]